MFTTDELETAVAVAFAAASPLRQTGSVARYIPELAKADPNRLAIAIRTIDGNSVGMGDTEDEFTFQSLSKVFTLSAVLARQGPGVLADMSCEPSGDAFHSIVRLEEEQGRPRNPYINAGAILVSERLPGADAGAKIDSFVDFLEGLSGGVRPEIDVAVYRSEFATGNRNRALAHFMKHYKLVDDPSVAVDTYFRQCSLRVNARLLARMGLFLANGGVDPVLGRSVLERPLSRTVVALMSTCGLYDEVGRFAVQVGLPAKSGVSGAILAIVPGEMTIAVYSPGLGPKGNSIAGMAALTTISERLGLSLFDRSA